MRKLKWMNDLAARHVGDGKSPNVFFVCLGDKGVVMVSQDGNAAHDYWRSLPRNVESSLEDRKTGMLAHAGPDSDEPGVRLITYDDYRRTD